MITRKFLPINFGLVLLCTLSCLSCGTVDEKTDKESIVRFERSDAVILKGIYIPNEADMFFTSGLVAPLKPQDSTTGSAGQYGSTYEQSIGALNRVKETLDLKQFSLKDLVQLRIYLVPDASGVIDYQSFFLAYENFFKEYPDVPQLARTTIGVHSLARPGLLVEIEAVAAK